MGTSAIRSSRRLAALVLVLLLIGPPVWSQTPAPVVVIGTTGRLADEMVVSTPLVLSPLDTGVTLRILDLAWPASVDVDTLIAFGLERSFDGGQTWAHWVSATTHPGGRARTNEMPSMTTSPPEPGVVVRAFMRVNRASTTTGLQLEVARRAVIGRAEAAYADTTRKAENAGGGVGSVSITLNSTVAGNLVVVGTSCYSNASDNMATSTVTDGANTYGNVFRSLASSGTERQGAQLFQSVLGTGGNRTIVVDPGANLYDMWAAAHEFSGPAATPGSGTPVTATGTTETTSDTGAFTPADADCLFVAVDGNSASDASKPTENASPGDTDWTLSNQNSSGAGAEPGSMVFFIQSGGPTARRSAWSIASGTFWAVGQAGFKPAAGAGGAAAVPQRTLTGVGQ